jgi:hypothetical protein
MLRSHAAACLAILAGACASAPAVPSPFSQRSSPGLVARLAPAGPDPGPEGEAAAATLRVLEGRVPLLYLAHGPWSETAPYEPAYAVAVYDDGTVAYEGHRCVKVGGLLLTRLAGEDVDRLRGRLRSSCSDLGGWNEDELCGQDSSLRLLCSNGSALVAGTDHCRRDQEQGKRVAALAAALAADLGLDAWLGEPTARQACEPGARDLAPREMSRTLIPGPTAHSHY